jgi:hypothetical protein
MWLGMVGTAYTRVLICRQDKKNQALSRTLFDLSNDHSTTLFLRLGPVAYLETQEGAAIKI